MEESKRKEKLLSLFQNNPQKQEMFESWKKEIMRLVLKIKESKEYKETKKYSFAFLKELEDVSIEELYIDKNKSPFCICSFLERVVNVLSMKDSSFIKFTLLSDIKDSLYFFNDEKNRIRNIQSIFNYKISFDGFRLPKTEYGEEIRDFFVNEIGVTFEENLGLHYSAKRDSFFLSKKEFDFMLLKLGELKNSFYYGLEGLDVYLYSDKNRYGYNCFDLTLGKTIGHSFNVDKLFEEAKNEAVSVAKVLTPKLINESISDLLNLLDSKFKKVKFLEKGEKDDYSVILINGGLSEKGLEIRIFIQNDDCLLKFYKVKDEKNTKSNASFENFLRIPISNFIKPINSSFYLKTINKFYIS